LQELISAFAAPLFILTGFDAGFVTVFPVDVDGLQDKCRRGDGFQWMVCLIDVGLI
jgi:hypothetical protein